MTEEKSQLSKIDKCAARDISEKKCSRRRMRILILLVVASIVFLVTALYFGRTLLSHTTKVGQQAYSAPPATAVELVTPVLSAEEWTGGLIVCPYMSAEGLPEDLAKIMREVNLDTLNEGRNYLITQGQRLKVLEFSRGEIDLCGENQVLEIQPKDSLKWITRENTWVLSQIGGN